ncbi:unnamed protein product, partial [Rotaria sp. Silwood2]
KRQKTHQFTQISQKHYFSGRPSSRNSNGGGRFVVYIPDLPADIDSNQLLENIIRQRLELIVKQIVLDIKCDAELGIGIVYLRNDEDKNYLINIVGKIAIKASKNTTVSFVDELELISYIVVDGEDMENLPSGDEICRR